MILSLPTTSPLCVWEQSA